MYNQDLAYVIKGETSGRLQQCYMALLRGEHLTHSADQEEDQNVAADVLALYKAGEGKWSGTDEAAFIKKLTGTSRKYRNKLYNGYTKAYHRHLDDAIRSEFWMPGEGTICTVRDTTRCARLPPPDTTQHHPTSRCGGSPPARLPAR